MMMDKPFFLHQYLNNFDQFCDNARNWKLDYRQLDHGTFSSELLIFGNNEIQFNHGKLGRRMLQNGAAPQGLITFGVLANPDISINWRNIDISGNMLFVFPESGELHSISNADFDVFVVSLSAEKLNKVCFSLQQPDIKTLINNHEVFRCNPQRLAEIRHWLLAVSAELSGIDCQVRNLRYLKYIEEEASYKLINILSNSRQVVSRKTIRRRDIALSIIDDYIANASTDIITVAELTAIANVSERTLEYAFRERYGLTPKNYTLVYRLNSVRKQLLKSNPDTSRVSSIAQQHNFWHMGQFSTYYKKLFGELPSATLRRN